VDLRQELEGEVFEPLKDLIFFQAFTFSADLHTVTGPTVRILRLSSCTRECRMWHNKALHLTAIPLRSIGQVSARVSQLNQEVSMKGMILDFFHSRKPRSNFRRRREPLYLHGQRMEITDTTDRGPTWLS